MSQFKKMVGKSYLYMGKEVQVKGVDPIGEDLFRVTTNDRVINMRASELRKEFLPIDGEIEKVNELFLYRGIQVESRELGGLATVLMDTIRKVQEEPKYVDQARTINDTAKTLIDLKRAQIELIRLLKS